MTTALLESPLSLSGEPCRTRSAGGRGSTLEELLDKTLRSVRTDGSAECPVCSAQMHAAEAAARCSGCGSTLS